jgi:hypothetical protein
MRSRGLSVESRERAATRPTRMDGFGKPSYVGPLCSQLCTLNSQRSRNSTARCAPPGMMLLCVKSWRLGHLAARPLRAVSLTLLADQAGSPRIRVDSAAIRSRRLNDPTPMTFAGCGQTDGESPAGPGRLRRLARPLHSPRFVVRTIECDECHGRPGPDRGCGRYRAVSA